MNNDPIFRVILAILFILVIGTRRYFERKSAEIAKDGLRQDMDSRAMVIIQSLLLTLSNLGMITYLINPNWMTWSSLTIQDPARWLGVVLGVTGTGLLIWTHRVLGDNFFGGTKIRSGHQIITNGPYRLARHPMYTAFILLGIAWLLLSGNWLIGGLWLTSSLLVIGTRLNKEEQMMLQEFGDIYRDYMQKTGRFSPWI